MSPVVAVLSPLSTELRAESQIGSWYYTARGMGAPVRLIASVRLCIELQTTRVQVLFMQNASVLPAADADCVNEWLDASSTAILIQRSGFSGMFDEIGQRRQQSVLTPALATQRVLDNPAEVLGVAAAAATKAHAWVVGGSTAVGWQLAPFANSSTLVLHGLQFNTSSSRACPAGHPYIYGSVRRLCVKPASQTNRH